MDRGFDYTEFPRDRGSWYFRVGWYWAETIEEYCKAHGQADLPQVFSYIRQWAASDNHFLIYEELRKLRNGFEPSDDQAYKDLDQLVRSYPRIFGN